MTDTLSPILGLLLLCNSNQNVCYVATNDSQTNIYIAACLDPTKEYDLKPLKGDISIPLDSEIKIFINTKNCTTL